MKKIIDIKKAGAVSKEIKSKNKLLVLTGGCFDILHIGHIKLLEKSKKCGDFLMVLVENDKTVKKLKGKDRPINSQKERAEVLSSISFVDYVVLLPEMTSNSDYDQLMQNIKPDIITNTKGDPQEIHNQRQAKLIGAKVIHVLQRIDNKSTTNLAKLIAQHFK